MKQEGDIRKPQHHDYMAPNSIDPKRYRYKSPMCVFIDIEKNEVTTIFKPAYFSRVFRKGGASAKAGDIVEVSVS